MLICGFRFNIIFLIGLGASLVGLCSCQSPESKQRKLQSTLRVHLENPYDRTERTQKVPIGRAEPVMINIDKMPFVTEENVKQAKVVETVGGFMISIQLDKHGTMMLEQYSSASHGKRFAIFSQFVMDPGGKTNFLRWLGAPKISARIGDGILNFTPDADREEALNIVLGLNNVARKVQKAITW
jgi:preprotein translocase subunit SecD